MQCYTFSTQEGKAYYYNSIPNFIHDTSSSIIGELVKHAFEVGKEQTDAWGNQIQELQIRLNNCGMDGDIIFEYDINSNWQSRLEAQTEPLSTSENKIWDVQSVLRKNQTRSIGLNVQIRLASKSQNEMSNTTLRKQSNKKENRWSLHIFKCFFNGKLR